MSLKEEHFLNKDDGKSQYTEICSNEIDMKKDQNLNTVEERPIFQCCICGLTEHYDCFSNQVPFNRNIKTKADVYIARDPFSPRTKKQYLILGSACSICDKDICLKPECSLFYSKYFCSSCTRVNITHFPPKIQEKIRKTNRI
ncbi:cysteine-rich DPF motif domain-containing protein 1 [Daktulosphaira vitifoliae]|uniref:cysteine-rich DPF motif domain-containing protein 1 n=1 Tax=Daktulosphaira vitifoliae TaxID=58002 RepID=UPI0021A9E163|nr:cysteine-rich DPF motif domain-containing protein 1 [Daktulosphaira vitifoliae]